MSRNAQDGNVVQVNYIGTLDDGTEFDNSYERGEPIAFVVGGDQVLPAFSQGVLEMQVGEKRTLRMSAEEGYGERRNDAIQVFPLESFPEGMEFQVGMQVQGEGPNGPFPAVVTAVAHNGVVLDLNHPLAGQPLNFEVEMVNIEEQPQEGTG